MEHPTVTSDNDVIVLQIDSVQPDDFTRFAARLLNIKIKYDFNIIHKIHQMRTKIK